MPANLGQHRCYELQRLSGARACSSSDLTRFAFQKHTCATTLKVSGSAPDSGSGCERLDSSAGAGLGLLREVGLWLWGWLTVAVAMAVLVVVPLASLVESLVDFVVDYVVVFFVVFFSEFLQ